MALTKINKAMETSREYYDRIMSEYREKRGRRGLRKYCQDEGIDYQWLMKSRKEYSSQSTEEYGPSSQGTAEHFIPLEIMEPVSEQRRTEWTISQLVLSGPVDEISINAGTMASVIELLHRLA